MRKEEKVATYNYVQNVCGDFSLAAVVCIDLIGRASPRIFRTCSLAARSLLAPLYTRPQNVLLFAAALVPQLTIPASPGLNGVPS